VIGFIARTSIPFGPLTVSFGYGLGVGPPPQPPVEEEPTLLEDRAGPGRRRAGAIQGPRLARRLQAQAFPKAGSTTGFKGKRTTSASAPIPRTSTKLPGASLPRHQTSGSAGKRRLTVTAARGPKKRG
jgi:hypothetical protein